MSKSNRIRKIIYPSLLYVSLLDEVPLRSRLPIMDILVQEQIAFLKTEKAARRQKEAAALTEVKARLADELARTENAEEFLAGLLEYLRERQGKAVKMPETVDEAEASVNRPTKTSVPHSTNRLHVR